MSRFPLPPFSPAVWYFYFFITAAPGGSGACERRCPALRGPAAAPPAPPLPAGAAAAGRSVGGEPGLRPFFCPPPRSLGREASPSSQTGCSAACAARWVVKLRLLRGPWRACPDVAEGDKCWRRGDGVPPLTRRGRSGSVHAVDVALREAVSLSSRFA